MTNKIRFPLCSCGTKVYVTDTGADGIALARYFIMCPVCNKAVWADTRKLLLKTWLEEGTE